MAAIEARFAVRGSEGISMVHGTPPFKAVEAFGRDDSPRCRVMTFSSDGSLFAWCNAQCVIVVETSGFNLVCRISKGQTQCLAFSPKGTHLSTWEPYTVNKDRPTGTTNLEIWNVKNGNLVAGFPQKKKDSWMPKWSADESVCARSVTNEVHCYHNADFTSIAAKLRLQGVSDFELSPGPPPLTVAGYVPGVKGAPSFVRLFHHPNFDNPASVLANKSFFKADRVKILWNKKGRAVLVITTTDVDKSGASYYGEQTLHYISTSGESSSVLLAKRGPIYSAQWSPNSKEFCVVYGFMPAKATLFDIKCEPLFDFGTGPRNEVFYNPHGNSLAGFGNLRGQLEMWSRKDLKLISKPQASDSTSFEWAPDGKHILTATTSPRLREGNGFKIWHYSGSLLHEERVGELWEVKWQSAPDSVFEEPVISYSAVPSIAEPEELKPKHTYRPPHLRGIAPSVKVHEHEPPENLRNKAGQGMSKSALKNKKKREAKARAKQEQEEDASSQGASGTLPSAPVTPATTSALLFPDKEKKLRNLKKKLRQIEDLKEKQKAGKKLEKNQMDKLAGEASLLQEIKALEIGS